MKAIDWSEYVEKGLINPERDFGLKCRKHPKNEEKLDLDLVDWSKIKDDKLMDNKKIASELLKIAKELTAGHSYPTDIIYVVVWGKQPFNVDVIRAINDTWIPIKDDNEDEIDAQINLVGHEGARGGLTYLDEKKGMVRETRLALRIPKKFKASVMDGLTKTLKQFGMKVEETVPGYMPKIRKG